MLDTNTIIALILFIFLVTVVPMGFHIIRKNECGVLILNGQPVRMLYPGLIFTVPFITRIHRIDLNSPTWESELKELRGPNFIPPKAQRVKREHRKQLEMLDKRRKSW